MTFMTFMTPLWPIYHVRIHVYGSLCQGEVFLCIIQEETGNKSPGGTTNKLNQGWVSPNCSLLRSWLPGSCVSVCTEGKRAGLVGTFQTSTQCNQLCLWSNQSKGVLWTQRFKKGPVGYLVHFKECSWNFTTSELMDGTFGCVFGHSKAAVYWYL